MVEILKPNDYKQIIDGLYELDNEIDIIQYLEGNYIKHIKDNYHYSTILLQKISAIDDYDSSEDALKYYYEKGNNDPACEIETYASAPNPVIRFAKVFIDYMSTYDERTYPDENREKGEIEESDKEGEFARRVFVTDFDKGQLKKLYQYLTKKEIIEAHSLKHFLAIFDGYEIDDEMPNKVKWRLRYQNRFNSNLPMITLFRFASTLKDDTNKFYGNERKEFIETLMQNITSANERHPSFNPKSLNNSINDWIDRIKIYREKKKPSAKILPLDKESIDIIKFIEQLK